MGSFELYGLVTVGHLQRSTFLSCRILWFSEDGKAPNVIYSPLGHLSCLFVERTVQCLLNLVASACEVLEVTAEATTVFDTTRHHQGYLFLWVSHQRSCVVLKPPKLPSLSCILWPQIIRTEDLSPPPREVERSGRKGCSSWQRTKETLLKLWARCCFKGVPWQEFQGGCAWYSREKTSKDREGDVFADHLAWCCGSELREPAGWITCWA